MRGGENKTSIELDSTEVRMFKLFRQYQDEFKVLVENGVFDVCQGKVVLHKDKQGNLRQIDVERVSYRYRPSQEN